MGPADAPMAARLRSSVRPAERCYARQSSREAGERTEAPGKRLADAKAFVRSRHRQPWLGAAADCMNAAPEHDDAETVSGRGQIVEPRPSPPAEVEREHGGTRFLLRLAADRTRSARRWPRRPCLHVAPAGAARAANASHPAPTIRRSPGSYPRRQRDPQWRRSARRRRQRRDAGAASARGGASNHGRRRRASAVRGRRWSPHRRHRAGYPGRRLPQRHAARSAGEAIASAPARAPPPASRARRAPRTHPRPRPRRRAWRPRRG